MSYSTTLKGFTHLGGAASRLALLAFLVCSSEGNSPDASCASEPARTAGLSAKADADLQDVVNQTLGLRASVVATLAVEGTPASGIRLHVPMGDSVHELELHEHSVRAEGYKVLAQLVDGSYEEVAPGPIRTMRGHVTGVAGSIVAAAMEDDGLYAGIFLPGGEQYWVQPIALRVANARADEYAIYRSEDIVEPHGTCGVDDILVQPQRPVQALGIRLPQGSGPACGTGLCEAELAVDADHEYYLSYGSSIDAVTGRIENVISTVNVQYERDVGITHVITTIIVRTSAESDPYSSSVPFTLLNEFSSEWVNNQESIQRDLAQLFTGKALVGYVGMAFSGGGVCDTANADSKGYSLVQSDFNAGYSFGYVTNLSAHEFGHNWGANHCNCDANGCFCNGACPECYGYTMNRTITGSYQFHEDYDISEIKNFRDLHYTPDPEDCPSSICCLTGVVGGCSVDADCDDGDDCNGSETCIAGSCALGTPQEYGTPCSDDGIPCTDDICNTNGMCTHPCSDALCCDDNNPCTTDECTFGVCLNMPTAFGTACPDDGNPCTNDACDVSGACTHPNEDNGTACDDGLFCNGPDACSDGSCSTHMNPPCPPNNDKSCADCCDESTDTCTGQCANGSGCNDGLFCNGTDTCSNGGCTIHSDPPCPPDNDSSCTDCCKESTDSCTAQCPNGSSCSGGTCSDGQCTPACGNGVCDPGENCNNCPGDCDRFSICGNNVCEPSGGEDCLSCSQDCNGVQSGSPDNHYCCGDGAGQNTVGCGDPRCTGSDNTCSNINEGCCSDGICEGLEHSTNSVQ